jgi:hypothetical protein
VHAHLRATLRRLAVLSALALLALPALAPAYADAAVSGGSIEVCLSAANGQNGKAFQFSLNGGTTFRVLGGGCSGPLSIAPGPVTVAEVASGSAVSAILVRPANRQINTDVDGATATVAVPGGSTAATRTIVTFTQAGSGSGDPDSPPAATGMIDVCKAAANGMDGKVFQFSLNGGTPFSVIGGGCSGPMSTQSGPNVVIELSSGIGQVSGIDIVPSTRLVSTNLVQQSVTATVPAGSTIYSKTRVTFTNSPPSGPTPPGSTTGELKVCKVSRTPAYQGRLFSFSYNAGPAFSIEAGTPAAPVCSTPVSYPLGTRVLVQELETANVLVDSITVSDGRGSGIDPSGRAATATIGTGATVVTFDNEPAPISQLGYVEVCKDAFGPDVSGQFQFTVTAPGFSTTLSAYVGQCSEPVAVPAGNVTITESARQGYELYSVSTNPSDRLFGANLINREAVVEVPVGDASTETQVHFVNHAITAQLKVCKALAAGSDVLDAQTFFFAVTRHADAETPGPVQRVRIRANAQSTQCVIVGNFPVGEQLSVDELFSEDLPDGDADKPNAPSDEYIDASGEGLVTLTSGINSVTVANRAVGLLEICKAPVTGINVQPTFRFRVDGGAVTNVRAGFCSLPIRVSIGTHAVLEVADPDYELDPNAPGSGIQANPVDRGATKNLGLRTITVTVPYGADGETGVMFANRLRQGRVKVCKLIPSGSQDSLGSRQFDYAVRVAGVDYAVNGIRPGECSTPIGPWNLLQPNGTATVVTVQEDGAGPAASFDVTGIACSGCRAPIQPDLAAGRITFLLGPDTDSLTFTNTARP